LSAWGTNFGTQRKDKVAAYNRYVDHVRLVLTDIKTRAENDDPLPAMNRAVFADLGKLVSIVEDSEFAPLGADNANPSDG
jgi:hypothetical protein